MIRLCQATLVVLLSCIVSLPATAKINQWYGVLSFFADEDDARLLLNHLNADTNIAFIIHDGPRWNETKRPATGEGFTEISCGHPDHHQRWRAVRPVDRFEATDCGEHTLWHVPSGPLPMLKAGRNEPNATVPDPWAGWVEEHPNQHDDKPAFGEGLGPKVVIDLRLMTCHQDCPFTASEIQWQFPSPEARQWWIRFEAWVAQNAVKLEDPLGGDVFWAFPSALRRLKGGLHYEARGFHLDTAIKRAEFSTSVGE
jgi:hypothetical protein